MLVLQSESVLVEGKLCFITIVLSLPVRLSASDNIHAHDFGCNWAGD
jgi:hypothetical protein